MKLVRVSRQHSSRKGFFRVTGEIVSDTQGRLPEIWIEVPSQFAGFTHENGDPWLILMVCLATIFGEDVDIDCPVDPLLVDNLRALTAIWKTWHSFARLPVIRALHYGSLSPAGDERASSALFSGGVDSLFTALRNGPNSIDYATAGSQNSRYLLRIWHADTSIERSSEYFRKAPILHNFADRVGSEIIDVGTNCMVFSNRNLDWWGPLSHGPALAFVAHCLSGGIKSTLVASSHPIFRLIPWGSHPLTDPLLSSTKLSVAHDGSIYNRFEKTRYIAAHCDALQVLDVCGGSKSTGASYLNCSRCQKCIRTMAALDILGRSGFHAPTFDWSHYTPTSLMRLFLKNEAEIIHIEEVYEAACAEGRYDLSRAAQHCLRRSRRFLALGRLETRMRRKFPAILRHRGALIGIRSKLYRALGLRR